NFVFRLAATRVFERSAETLPRSARRLASRLNGSVLLSRPAPVAPIPRVTFNRQGPPDGGPTDVHVPRHRPLHRPADARLPLSGLHPRRPAESSLSLRRACHAAA